MPPSPGRERGARSLVDVLRARAAELPDQVAYRFLEDGEREGESVTFQELDRRARALGAFLRDAGGAGERALLLYPPGLEFVTAFLGCLYGGVVAVPAYPPRTHRPDPRLQAIAADARPRFALTTPALRDRAANLVAGNPRLAGVQWVATEEIDPAMAGLWEPPPGLGPDGLAFLQYTSGSTATPKGVVVRHGNLVHNERMIQLAFAQSERSVIVGWLPLYHDMGLIGNVLQPLYLGATCVLMAPVAFLQRPVRWLRAISRYRATTSGGPNFAYDLCARKIGREEREGLDLSSWKTAYNGAEPVRPETLARFSEEFAPHGFRREAFYPCYGLAEATLFVSGGTPGEAPRLQAVDAAALESGRAAAPRPDAPVRHFVSCGRPWLGQRVAIVDPESGRPRGEGEVGEVWVAGPSVAGGYWDRPEETAASFGARLADGAEPAERFLRTGDLGFLAGGELYLTGRAKDLIIVRGRNLYPQDVELTAERSHPGLRPGCGAAFAVDAVDAVDAGGEERLVVVQEIERDAERQWSRQPGTLEAVAETVRRAVAMEHEVAVEAVVLVRAATVPKTSSGKIRRRSCREDFLAGRLEPVVAWRAGAAEAAEPAAPRNPVEERVERIWAEVLGRERVGVDEDLFALGGDSLRAAQLAARVNEAFGVELPLDALFAAPTVAGVAALLADGAAPAAGSPRLERLPHPGAGGDLPLSFAQRRLWFLHQLDPDNPVHNIAAAVRLSGRLDVHALAAAFAEILERHEALRTGFAAAGEVPVQVVLPAAPLPLPVADLAPLPAAGREAEARRLGAALARLPFDLERGPFLRAALLRLGDGEHELVLALHHIASDGGSLAVLVRELGILYGAFAAGLLSPLPPLPVQYADFAVWQRRRLEEGGLEAGLAFWRARLAGDLPVVELPADRPRPAVLSYRGAHLERPLPRTLTDRLEALARTARATPFMALLAAFEALLHRWTGLDELVVGTPIDGRSRVELEGLIGVFINNLALRTSLAGEPGFGELLQRVRATAVEAYAHPEVPFERLVDELRPERDLSRTPLFQIMLVGQNAPLRGMDLAGLALRPREIDLGTARFDLAVSLAETEDGWRGTWKYATDLFDEPTLARLAAQLENLLAAALAEPQRPVARLPLLSAAESHQVVTAWNDTRTEYPEATLTGLLAAQAARTPDAVALEAGSERLTYGELWDRAGRLADHLRTLGIEPDALVGICAERSTEMVAGLLGILRAGAAYVPIDPAYPADRIAYMLEDSAVPVLLAQSQLDLLDLPCPQARIVALDRFFEAGGPPPSHAPFPAFPDVDPDCRAYAIYTSGSTGRPKGAAVPHRGIVNRLLWMQSAFRLTAADRVLQKTPFSFDVSVWEFFWPLIAGARLVVAPPGAHQDGARLAELIRDHGVTTLHFVPSMLQIFLDQEGLAAACGTVRQVFASGEALPFDLQERFLDRLPGVALHNLYGPTEASVDVTWHACARGGERQSVPIGRPVANTAIVLLDRHLQPVPAGVPGELFIGGVQLARGYLNRPELTAERFVPDPTAGTPGARLYRTGDLARFRPDGEVEFLGRLDFQVKIRGVRVELGEIEAALASHAGVREAVVLARRESTTAGGAEARLVAYLVPAAAGEPAAGVSGDLRGELSGELRAWLRDRLPEAMVPSAFVVLPALPLNPSGKVDRRALPAPEAGRPELERAYAEPRDALERRLAGMWSELLKAERVGIHDNFFELGGDSIQGALFVNRLQKELGRIVYVMALFDAPTVAELAAYLRESYADAVGRLGGEAAAPAAGRAAGGRPSAERAVEELREAVVRRLGRGSGHESLPPHAGPRLAPAVFVLSPFRSGSTLLRVMLAGHSRLFAPPELELLSFATLGERARAYSGRNRFAVEGLLRAVMELRGCDAEAARVAVAALEEQDLPVAAMYARLQEEAGGRLIVDKTPSYVLDRATLARAEELFDEPLYIHLVRHPRATVDSYVEARMDQVYQDFPFDPETQAEAIWLLGHRNVLEHLAGVPARRQHRLLFEDLVKDPRAAMAGVARALGLGFEPTMLDPYEGRRMTDGLHAGTRMMGDPKFHQHRGIEAAVADRWRDSAGALGEEARILAAALGYTLPAAAPAAVEEAAAAFEARPVPREPGVELPLSFSQERLWFLAQLDPESAAYNMPAAIHLEGRLDVAALARSFAAARERHEVLRTVFPAIQGRPAQVVLPAEPADPLPVVDLAGLPAAGRDAEQRRLALEEGRRPFDLASGPMLRTTLLRRGGEEHVLLVTMHHVVSDGWTIGILIRELGVFYGAFAQGLPSPLAPLPLQYADYAFWQRRWLAGPALEEHVAWWRRRLAPPLPVLEMPADRPRPAVQTFRGARLSRTLPPARTEALRAWSQQEGATFFLALLAGFGTLLHRYTAQDDLLIGVPIANRNRVEAEGLIGVFLNMVAHRVDAAGDPPLRELLARVRDAFVASIPHQEIPFERLVEALQPQRDLSRPPVFQIQLSLQNTPAARLELPGVTLAQLEVHNRTTKFDFTVFLFDQPEGLVTTLEYNTDLYDGATIERLLRHWETLLSGAVEGAARRLSDLPLLAGDERRQLLAGWNRPENRPDAAFADAPALHRRFERQAELRPGAVAVVHDVEELTYRRLDERANRLANRLRALGVGPETPVVLCVERSLDILAGILGILKAGGAYVPLDPAYPPERLSWILQDALRHSAAPVLVTQSRLAGRFLEEGGRPFHVVRLDADRELLAAESAERPEIEVSAANLAYIIYTSGSTGRPKGVPVTHGNVARLFAATEPWFDFAPDDVWTLFHSFAFDFSVWEIWGALLYGGRVVVVPRAASLSPAVFLDLLASEKVTVLSQTPSAFRQVVQADEEEPARLVLRQVVFGGEALDLAALRPWIARRGDERPALVNMYGITETTVHVTWRPVLAADLERPGASPVGEPIPDLQVHLLGPRLELLPVGVPGEIHVGGAGLARGYLNRPELTAERFVPDPFSGRPGARLYRSGDLARRRPDGDLDYLGRIDGQVKIRGFRIELGEIEAALHRHPEVREAVVLARPDSTGGRRLVAWVVPREARAPEDLREHLLASLPEYMVPSAFVALDRLPLTGHGKVDRRALPDPGEARAEGAAVAPRSREEIRLAEIWREVLRVEQVGIDDNFFELGGHSLLVAQLSSRVRAAFGVDLPLRTIFEVPTLAALAARLAGLLPETGGAAAEEPEAIPRVPRGEPLPLSFGQERLWFLDRLTPGSPVYNIWTALRLHGALDVALFAAALAEVVRRHEILRTTFRQVGAAPRQVIHEAAAESAAGLSVVDLRGLEERARETESLRWLKAASQRPFDLERGPLLRTLLLRVAADDWRALFELHHIIGDGWSNDVLIREVGTLYTAFAAGLPSPLPELPVQYADFAGWQRRRLDGELLAAQTAYWRETLAGVPPLLDLPADRPRPAVQRYRGRDRQQLLSGELVQALAELCRAEGATLFMGLLAGLETLLHRITGRDDIVVGTPVAGRHHVEVEGLIGLFINSLALRADLGGDPSFREVVARTREVTLGAYAHQDLPFERLVQELSPERKLSHAPLFQVMLVLQNPAGEHLSLPGVELSALPLEESSAKVDLTLNAREADGGLAVRWVYNRDLFDEPTVARLSGHLERLLSAAVADPGVRISEIALLTPAEELQLLEWNATAAPYPTGVCLHELVAAQAARTPAAPAVSCGDAVLTYRELDAAAGRLAHRLAALGVGPDVAVGVFAERSLEMVVALLGVLRAGGAYLPVDPDYPADRVAYMLADSGVPVLLAQEHLLERLPEHGARVVSLAGAAAVSGEASGAAVAVQPSNLAYVIYTSGSTGRPKGTMNSHRGIVNRLLWMLASYELGAGDRVLQKTPFSFDVSVWEFFWPLLAGARLVMARPGGHQDPAYLVETIVAEGITAAHFVPSMLQVFVEAPGVERCTSLRWVICSGEALPLDLARRCQQRLAADLHNLYGPTEAAVEVTHREVGREEGPAPAAGVPIGVPIGVPLANTQIWLLDRNQQRVPVGVPGELHIGGVQLARGYLARPELTAEKFIPDPFAGLPGGQAEAGGRLYRTGDLARHLPDGAVDFLGRIDHQVKVRGLRIELGEIEAALAAHPAIREAVVLARSGGAAVGDVNLVAYATVREGMAAPALAELRTLMGRRLPEYMLPAALVVLESMPLSPSGKADRKALAGIAPGAGAAEAVERVAPRNALESFLAGLFAETLRGESFGVHDNFFDLGGNSITGAIFINRLQQELGETVAVVTIFDHPTVAKLAGFLAAEYPRAAERVAGAEAGAEAGELTGSWQPIPRAAAAAAAGEPLPLPLSFAQERFWFLDQLDPGNALYNIPGAFRLHGDLARGALAAAFAEIVRRHEALRTGFGDAEGRPLPAVTPEAVLEMPLADLSRLPGGEREAELARLGQEAAGRPFVLDRPPLLRLLLVRLGTAEHVLFATFHHIVADGWSMGVLVREVAALYRAGLEGRPAALPALPVQYADYAAWQRRQLSPERAEAALSARAGELAGASLVLDLPADRPRPPVQGVRGGLYRVELPASAAARLRAQAQDGKATLFMVLLAGFEALLTRWTGQEDYLVGTPMANRGRHELEGLIGLFANTVVLRARLEGEPAWRGLLARVREESLGAFARQDLPFEQLVERLEPHRDLSRSPLFQVMFVLQNAPLGRLDLPGLTLEPLGVDAGTSRFDLTLQLHDGAGLAGSIEFAADLFDEPTIERFWSCYRNLLESALAAPDRPVSELEMLGEAERFQVLEGWNRTRVELPAATAVPGLISGQARRAPARVAVASRGEELTYAELDARSSALARRLRALGAGPETRIGIALERTPALLVALLGVMKSGAAYVPLDPSHPRERRELILEMARPLAILTEAVLSQAEAEALGTAEEPEESFEPDLDGLAYVMFTSGSTGRPKGVQISHRALLSFLLSMQREPGFGADDALLAVTTLAFDIAGLELLLPLVSGGRVELASREEAADGALLRERLARSRATVLQATPASWRMLLDSGWEGDRRLKALCGGEALPGELAGRLLARAGELWNVYGPTETTVWSAARRVEPAEAAGASVAVGGAIANTRLYVLDRRLNPVPVGVPGELSIGGLGLARGYVEAPHLTAERFVPDPFAGAAGARMYRTGDLVRWRPDGRIEFLGRLDFQVKVRGFRIELGEIEAALLVHPGVRQAVAGVRGEGGDRHLVAWLVAAEPAPAAAALREHLRARLPEYMVPPAFAMLPALPLNTSGKVDRKALPEPDREARVRVAPRTPVEELIAGIWQELLGVEEVGADDNFFALGGHSLLATQLASRLRRVFGVEVPVRRLFEAPTLAHLAEAVGETGAPLPPIERRRDGERPRLSFGQERLWFLDRLNPDTAAYNITISLRLAGALDLAALSAALREIVRRHEILRTTFAQLGGEPRQVIAEDSEETALALPVVELRALPEAARAPEALRLLQAASERPFDLARGPLVRGLLARLDDGEWRGLFSLHHIVSDGWSTDVLLRELRALYTSFAEGRPSPLPELPVQYADFAEWQRGWLRGDGLAAQMAYWRERLAGAAPLLDLPADRPRPAVQRYRGRDLRRVLSAGLTRRLAALCRADGATLFMGLLTGFEVLLHRWTGREDLVLGTPVAGRNRLETEGLIGLFLNSLVLRTSLAGEPSFREALARTRETVLGAFTHQDLPFEKLVEELAPQRNLSHAPVYQAMLVLQNPTDGDLSLPGLELARLPLAGTTAKLDLTLNAQEVGGELYALWLYNRDLFDEPTVARLAGHLERLLSAAVEDPEARISEIALLTPAEERQLAAWNATAAAYPAAVCLHELIAAQAARTPTAVAVTCGEAALTYGELDAAAGRLARRLAALGVGPDVPVGVFAERSLEMVVALLGVLRAGGAYLPVDPDYPADRVAYMLADSGVPVLLAQEHLLERLPEHGARVVGLGAAADPEPDPEPGPEPAAAGPSNLAYVIYTSGSTGRPKGTMNSHRGIVNRLLWMQERYELTAADQVLQKTPFSFDVSVWEFFWPLLTGASLVMARPGGHQDPAYLVETIVAEGITTLHFVPSMLQVFVDARGVERCLSLRRVVCSGEALPLDLARRFQERLGAELHNLYGPTEAAVDVTHWQCGQEEGRAAISAGVPIGVPVANTQIWLLDRNQQRVPVGVPGELHIGGVQLARGYLARPELTAEKFIPDPFVGGQGEAGARLYRTGDLARYLPDGAVDFLGRIDHQVKVRGLRIELGEIEAALAAHPAIREAVVLARSGGAAVGDVNLVAYATVREGMAAPALAELRALLGRQLPEYMLPAALVMLEAMPLSPNGKADRKALAGIAPEAGAAEAAERVAPRNALERFLADLFAETLRGDGFGVHSSFFDLGGNSITGAIFVNRLQQALGEIVHVVTIFDHPTVAQLAGFLAAEYPRAVERVAGAGALAELAGAGGRAARQVDEAVIREVERLVRRLGPLPEAVARLPRNPPAVFVLSPPRSGSTLLRVMLGGHPALFAPPELELLNFDTLAERRDAFPGRDAFRLEGLLRAVMAARRCGPDEAREMVETLAREGLSTREMYGRLQEWIGGRMLVDKTPTYAWDPEALRRAEAGFAEARYIHLVRHPLGVVRSFEEARIDQIFFHEDHPWTRREVAEALWTLAQRNTLDFLAAIPAGRRHTVVFEELLREPERVLRGVCGFLGLPYDPAMAEPYRETSARMTDGLHAESRMLGDVKFHQHGRVDSGVAETWREQYREESLGEPARELAARLGYELAASGGWRPIPRAAAAPGEPLPLSFAQERFWFLDRLDPGQPLYNIPSAARLAGRLDVPALAAALDEVVRRHAALRTTFAERQGRPVQIVHPPRPVPLPRLDLSALPAPRAGAEARRLAAGQALRSFDLAAGPLFRVALAALPGGDHALFLTLHHTVSDGWSIGVFLRETGALYTAFARREAPRLPEPPVQYTDYALWQRQYLSGATLEAELGEWRRRLAGLPDLRLPADRAAGSERDFRAGSHLFALPAELTARLRALAARSGATLFMTLLAALHTLLARHTGQDDLAVGSPVAGRNRAEVEGLIGFFVNTLVLRGDLSGGPTFAALLSREREAVLGAFAHQEVPFALLVETLRPERRLGRSPLVDVLFSLQNQPIPTVELPGLTIGPLGMREEGEAREAGEEGDVRTVFSLSLMLWEVAGGLSGGFGFNTALFDRTTLARWQEHFSALLAAVAEDPERRLDEIPLLSAAERQQLLEWSGADGAEVLLPSGRPAPIGIWGTAAGERVRRRADGALERCAEPAAAAAAEKAAAPVVAQVVAQEVARERAELSSRRETLTASKRELLEKRLRGLTAGRPAAPSASPARAAKAGAGSPLVPLQAGLHTGDNGAPPFFCVHAIGGAVFSYGELARRLGTGRAFYGIQAAGLEGDGDGPAGKSGDLAAMAAEYVAAVRGVQPHGPYHLGGWSMGGVVAFEMACQLREAGEDVALLALLDSHPARLGEEAVAGAGEEDLLRAFLLDQARTREVALPDLSGEPAGPPAERIEWLLARARECGLLKADVRPEQVRRLLGVYRGNLAAFAGYRPRHYPGRVTLFRPAAAAAAAGVPENGWGAVAAAVAVQTVPGDHYTMLAPPHVEALAERLKTCLDRARSSRE